MAAENDLMSEVKVNVLIIPDDNNWWTAVALELSLLGEGNTPEEALKELGEAVEAQVSFAVQNDSLDSIFTPAAKEYFEIFDQVKTEVLKQKILAGTKRGRKAKSKTSYQIAGLGVPEPRDDRFELIPAR